MNSFNFRCRATQLQVLFLLSGPMETPMAGITRRATLAGLASIIAMPAQAQRAWPERPITLVHGFPAGGPVDTVARILAEPLTKRVGQQVLVEARPGATGTAAAGQVARAAPDGYTLIALPATHVATAATFRSLPYRPVEDFSLISTTAEYPLVIATNSTHPIQSLTDLIAAAKKQSAPLQYGTAGVGSIFHLSMELFSKVVGIQLQHIPYRGGRLPLPISWVDVSTSSSTRRRRSFPTSSAVSCMPLPSLDRIDFSLCRMFQPLSNLAFPNLL
jgi:hypothetical protein